MSLVKNISGGPLDVPLLGRTVEDGETVEVPDVQADGTSPSSTVRPRSGTSSGPPLMFFTRLNSRSLETADA